MTHDDGQQLPPFYEPDGIDLDRVPDEPKSGKKGMKTRPSYSTKRKARGDEDIIKALPEACSNEAAAVAFVENMRWNGAPRCPRCGALEVKAMTKPDGSRNARFLWRCFACRDAKRLEQFTVRIGTVYEDSRLPMRVWTTALWMMASAKNGASALELSRVARITHKSALFVLHRLRFAMATDWGPEPKMKGNIVADETYYGPPKHGRAPLKERRARKQQGPKFAHEKQAVIAIRDQQTGEVRTRIAKTVTAANLYSMLSDNVDIKGSRLVTDKEVSYKKLGRQFGLGHSRTDHSVMEYVRYEDWGVSTTNPCESFFSRLKRSLTGTYHSVSRKHVHRYVSHAEFLVNSKGLTDGARLKTLVARANGKRLTYAEQVAG